MQTNTNQPIYIYYDRVSENLELRSFIDDFEDTSHYEAILPFYEELKKLKKEKILCIPVSEHYRINYQCVEEIFKKHDLLLKDRYVILNKCPIKRMIRFASIKFDIVPIIIAEQPSELYPQDEYITMNNHNCNEVFSDIYDENYKDSDSKMYNNIDESTLSGIHIYTIDKAIETYKELLI